MSKNKTPRAVMTLKDFHGGSIPSDLPLPSAPGMSVERSSFERQGSGAWMSPVGRVYGGNERNVGQNRQGLGSGVRAFEDKASLFPNPAHIGRNYDEDERKPVDGRPRSGHSAEQYEERIYDDLRPPSGQHDKAFNCLSGDEHGYKSMAPASYGQSSQANKPKAPVSSPPPYWRQQPQQPPAASVDHNSGANVWPARHESESNRMPSDLVRNQSLESASWQAQIPKPKTSDLGMPDKASSRSWQPDHSHGGTGHGNSPGNPELSKFSRWQSMYPKNMDQEVESYSSRGASSDRTRPGFGERSTVGESSRVQGGAARAGGYVRDDSGGRGLNGNGAIGGGGGYHDPGSRMTFFEKGRIGRVESDYNTREPSHPKDQQQADSGVRAYNPGARHDSYSSDSGYGASLPERSSHSSDPRKSRAQRGNGDQGDQAPADMDRERRRSPPLVESNRGFIKERSVLSAGGYLVGHSPVEAPLAASRPPAPLVTPEPVAERPRLKLLPRSKPLEMNEAVRHVGSDVPALEKEKDYDGKSDERRKDEPVFSEGKAAEAVDGSGFIVKGPSSNFESGDQGSKPAERPKLNLKPRSQPLEEGAASAGSDRARDSVFGGARPRELVLRARGANDSGTAVEDGIRSPPSPPVGHVPDSGKSKSLQQTSGRPGGSDSWGEEKHVRTPQSFECQAEGFMESQGPGSWERKGSKQEWVAPSKHFGDPEWKGRGDFDKQDNPVRYEVNQTYDRHAGQSRDPDRQELALHDLHKTNSCRRPASPPNPPTPAAVLTPFNNAATAGHHSFNAPASALELAKAFSQSSSIGSSMAAGFTQSNSGNNQQRTGPLVHSISRSQSYGGPGSMNGNGGGYGQWDASFSCLAEAAAAAASLPMNRDVHAPGSGYGGNRPYDRFGSYGGNKSTGGFGSGVGAMNSRLSHR